MAAAAVKKIAIAATMSHSGFCWSLEDASKDGRATADAGAGGAAAESRPVDDEFITDLQ